MPPRTHSSEFPNANFDLHDGAIWVTNTIGARPKAIVRPKTLRETTVPLLVVAPAPAVEPVVEATPDSVDDFPRLVDAMMGVLLDAGATRAAAGLRMLLDEGDVDASTLGDIAVGGGALVKQGSRIALSSEGLTTARAWRSLLGGASDDLSSCASTLDTWCAELLSALSGKSADDLRKALRSRGVAAFGLLAA